jgi:hypothetical protein
MLKTGLEWFKLLIVCFIATLAWQLSRGTENPELISRGKWNLFSTLLNADTGDRLMEQENYGSNEPPDAYDSADDCLQDTIHVLPPPQLDHITLLVNCTTVPPCAERGGARWRIGRPRHREIQPTARARRPSPVVPDPTTDGQPWRSHVYTAERCFC